MKMAKYYNYPPSNCPYHIKSYEECKEKRVTIVEPNGPCPPNSGIIGQIEHPTVTRINCFCNYGMAAALDYLLH